jgi:hypothetical protein
MMQNLLRKLLIVKLLLLSGCVKKEIPQLSPEEDFFKRNIKIPEQKKRIPELPPYPKQWKKKINISIGTGMPIKEFLRHAAIECGVSLNLDQVADFSGISYTAKNSEFMIILKNICRLAGWRIKINPSGDISVLRDSHYMHTHEVAFMCNLTKMKTSTNLKNFSKDERSHVGDLSSETQLNLWGELEKNLMFMLKEKDSGYSLNKQGGLLIVNATQAEHENIARFIKNLTSFPRTTSSGCFIEIECVAIFAPLTNYSEGLKVATG